MYSAPLDDFQRDPPLDAGSSLPMRDPAGEAVRRTTAEAENPSSHNNGSTLPESTTQPVGEDESGG